MSEKPSAEEVCVAFERSAVSKREHGQSVPYLFMAGYEAAYAAQSAEIARLRERVKDFEDAWTCEGCAFAFSREHENADGTGHTCPVCENVSLRAELAAVGEEVADGWWCEQCHGQRDAKRCFADTAHDVSRVTVRRVKP